MKHTTSILTICLCLTLTGTPILRADASVSAAPETRRSSAQPITANTISSPLLLDHAAVSSSAMPESSLLGLSPHMGGTGSVSFMALDEGHVHIKFQNLKQAAAFFWHFDEGLDLRDRWVKLKYSGENIPLAVLLDFESKEKVKEQYIYLQPFSRRGESFFKLPDHASFAEVTVIRLIFDPGLLGVSNADFRIEDVILLPKGVEPITLKKDFHGERPVAEGLPEPFTPGQASLTYPAK